MGTSEALLRASANVYGPPPNTPTSQWASHACTHHGSRHGPRGNPVWGPQAWPALGRDWWDRRQTGSQKNVPPGFRRGRGDSQQGWLPGGGHTPAG